MDSAVSISVGSLGVVLGKLQMLTSGYSRIKTLGTQIVSLRNELDSMHALLLHLSAMEADGLLVDVQVKAWAREVREFSCDVEDCVDSFAHQQRLGESHYCRALGKCARSLQRLRAWRQLAKQIDTLKKRAVEIAERRERYRQLDTLPGCSTGSRSATATASHGAQGVDPRLSAFFFDDGEDHLVGIDGPKYELVAWLLHGRGSTDHQKALFIVGSGGIGKTTLAKRVYLEIGGHFDCKASVSVSRKPNLMQILRDCLLQLCHDRDLCHDREFTEHIGEWDENTWMGIEIRIRGTK
ncbi:hypothetical protein HU200_034152 [Digitaria exilis]|uniref:Uncharacterized protein n=1 Tax=Digitaria exilis TaxID=1010633 RepID=A0A835BID1_9POAL|nr:hypothetical protein HU200_034152 [Digitaria exilis]